MKTNDLKNDGDYYDSDCDDDVDGDYDSVDNN